MEINQEFLKLCLLDKKMEIDSWKLFLKKLFF